jgi:hypothetical protein
VDWQPATVSLADVSGEYFATARMPVIEGRPFDDRDGVAAKPVVIVNDTLARQFWPNRSPIGRRLAIRDATLEVVGVVRTGKYQTVWESPRGAVFRPLAQAAARPSRWRQPLRSSHPRIGSKAPGGHLSPGVVRACTAGGDSRSTGRVALGVERSTA